MTLENHCCSSRLHRLVILHCKLFRFSKNTADRTEQGEGYTVRQLPSTLHKVIQIPALARPFGRGYGFPLKVIVISLEKKLVATESL